MSLHATFELFSTVVILGVIVGLTCCGWQFGISAKQRSRPWNRAGQLHARRITDGVRGADEEGFCKWHKELDLSQFFYDGGMEGCQCRCQVMKTELCAPHSVVHTNGPGLTLETRVSGKRQNQLKRRQAFKCAEMDFRQFFELKWRGQLGRSSQDDKRGRANHASRITKKLSSVGSWATHRRKMCVCVCTQSVVFCPK